MKKFKLFFTICFFTASIVNSSGYASDAKTLQISRYTTVTVTPTDAQIDPLASVVQIHFPASAQTIGQAISLLLNSTGFNLAPQEKRSEAVVTTLGKPLPIVDRDLGPITIRQALTILMGQNVFTLSVDELTREVNFILQNTYISKNKKIV